MMHRLPNFPLRVAASLVILATTLTLTSAFVETGIAAASSTGSVSSASGAVTNFQGCWSTSQKPTDVLVLMDTTASLQATDPMALRVVGLKAALRSMALANAANPDVNFRVRMVGFSQNLEFFKGSGFSTWVSVTQRSLPALYASAEHFADQKNGDFTNFANALAGSEALLGPQSATCKALLWFTDGASDESNNGQRIPAQPVEFQNTARICESGGVADSLVSDGIYSFAVGLTNQTGRAGQEELQTIVEGHSPVGPDPVHAGACGQNGPNDSVSTATGHFFNSPAASQLVFNMQQVFTPINEGGVGPSSGGLCPTQGACPAATQSKFWVGPGIKDFFIDSEAIGAGVTGALTKTPELVISNVATHQDVRITRGPNGTECYDPSPTPGNCSFDGILIEPTSIANGELAVAGIVPNGIPVKGLVLKYAILSSPGAGSIQYLFYETPSVEMQITPTPAQATQGCPVNRGVDLHAYIDCPTQFSLGLVNSSSGTKFTQGSLSNIVSTFDQSKVPITVTTPKSGEAILGFTWPSTSSPGPQSIQLHAVLHLGPNGSWPFSLGDRTVFTLRTPPGYPSVRIGSSETTLEPGQSKSTKVIVTPGSGGSSTGGCLKILHIAASDLAGLRVKSSAPRKWTSACVPLEKGRSVTFAVTTKLQSGTNGGPFTVNLEVQLGSATATNQLVTPSFQIPFRAYVPLNVGRSLLLLFLLLLSGLLFLLGIAVLVNLLTGRFAPLNVIMYRTDDVAIGDASLGFGEPNNPNVAKVFEELTSANDIESDDTGTKRHFTIDGLEFRATLGGTTLDRLKGLVNGATATVRDEGGSPLIVGGRTSSGAFKDGPSSVSLTLDGTWIFRPTAIEGFDDGMNDPLTRGGSNLRTVRGKLTFLVREGAGPEDFEALRQGAEALLSNGLDQFGSAKGLTGMSGAESSASPDSAVGEGPLFEGL